MNRVLRSQKRAVRCTARLRSRESYRKAFRTLEILTVPALFILESVLLAFGSKSFSKPMAPCSYVTDSFKSQCSQVYNYHRLLVWDETKALHMEIFKVPSCCSCHIQGYASLFPPNSEFVFDQIRRGENSAPKPAVSFTVVEPTNPPHPVLNNKREIPRPFTPHQPPQHPYQPPQPPNLPYQPPVNQPPHPPHQQPYQPPIQSYQPPIQSYQPPLQPQNPPPHPPPQQPYQPPHQPQQPILTVHGNQGHVNHVDTTYHNDLELPQDLVPPPQRVTDDRTIRGDVKMEATNTAYKNRGPGKPAGEFRRHPIPTEVTRIVTKITERLESPDVHFGTKLRTKKPNIGLHRAKTQFTAPPTTATQKQLIVTPKPVEKTNHVLSENQKQGETKRVNYNYHPIIDFFTENHNKSPEPSFSPQMNHEWTPLSVPS